jgi:diketogulonate reductase-like aldo/keto reductase
MWVVLKIDSCLALIIYQVNWIDTWKAMEKIYKEHPDKLKAIGVSNISVEFFEKLLEVAEVIPAVNQIELHPYVTLGFCGNSS